MKMKKLLSVVFLFSLIVSFTFVASNINAMEISEGAIIKTGHNPDVYIVKYKNGKQFKRLVLNPQVFESYGHLRWEDILIVDQSEMNSFVVSDLVRVDGQTDIYQLVPNGDVGTKVLLTSTVGYDLDLVYTINAVDFGNYVIGEVAGVTTQQQLENQQLVEEQRKQEELQKQKELEKKLASEQEDQRKAEEIAEKEQADQLSQKIKSDIDYFSNQISSVNQDVEQTANSYRISLDREKNYYLNQTEFYTSIYKPSITKRHREILNEASKGIWTDCTWLRDLWDYQDSDYQRYATGLNSAERTLQSNFNLTASSYIPNFNFYLDQTNQTQSIHIPTKEKLNQYLNQLNDLSVSDIEIFKRDIRNLISQLNSLESKLNDAKNYTISITTPTSILSEIEFLIQEEKMWFETTSCKNLPTN